MQGPRTATHEIDLERRSAYLMTRESREGDEHHIPAVTTLRYSVTFRTVRSEPFASKVFVAAVDACRLPTLFSFMIRPILKYGDRVLHEPARAVDAITPDIDRADRRHDRDDVRGAGRRAGGAAGRRAAADLRRRRLGRARSQRADRDHQPGVRRTRRHAARRRRLPERARIQRHGGAARRARSSRGSIATATEHQHEGTGLLARAFQHEMDHLDGTLFVDRLRGIKRDLIVAQDPEADARRQMVDVRRRCASSFFGTPEFAVPTLDALLALAAHRSSASSRSRIGRAAAVKRRRDAPVKARALAAGLPVLQPRTAEGRRRFSTRWPRCDADLGVVAAYGKILTDAVLAIPRLGMINVHASLLPRYRGAAPVHRAVIAGERETGVTIMRVVKALDAGPMLATARRPIGPDETSDEVERDLARARRRAARRSRSIGWPRRSRPRRRRTKRWRPTRIA